MQSVQAPTVGAAMHGAVAAGAAAGGYPDIATAAQQMGGLQSDTYRPIPAHVGVYDRLYQEYTTLYDYFGRGASGVMKRLRALRRETLTTSAQAAQERLERAALPDAIERPRPIGGAERCSNS